MQISNTNTVFFFESSPFQTKRQGAQMPFCEHSCLRAAKHDSAAMPTSSKTNPSPICLSSSGFGKNAFHRATDKQNSR